MVARMCTVRYNCDLDGIASNEQCFTELLEMLPIVVHLQKFVGDISVSIYNYLLQFLDTF